MYTEHYSVQCTLNSLNEYMNKWINEIEELNFSKEKKVSISHHTDTLLTLWMNEWMNEKMD